MLTIYADDLQEGIWFQELDEHLKNASIVTIPSKKADIAKEGLGDFLKYDRPDIILKDGDEVILVLERTVEVPSGHNVGQRYGRLVAAAMKRVPVVYFGPYAAYKHGGNTAGPRWMNLRLFYSLDNLAEEYDTAITTIRWPVDDRYEVVKNPTKDKQMKEYLELFFDYYDSHGFDGLTEYIRDSELQKRLLQKRQEFIDNEIANSEQYDAPPDSVVHYAVVSLENEFGIDTDLEEDDEVYLYNVGMRSIRSDPYTGMAALYTYLYCGDDDKHLILHFPEIHSDDWYKLRKNTKTYRMYKEFSEGIIFLDGFKLKDDL